jgi:hypothetical protein
MTDQSIPISYDNIEALGASAFATARDCVTVIQQHVLHNIEPLKRVGFERLIKAIEARQILTQEMLVELDVQICFLIRQIDAGTTQHEMYDNDECNVSNSRSWVETHLTQRAHDLNTAVRVLISLQNKANSIQDLLHADEAITELRETIDNKMLRS